MPENQTTSLQNPIAVAAPEAPVKASEIKTIADLMLMKPFTGEEWSQWAEDFKAIIARQTEEHRRAAEAINQGVERLLARIAKDRQEYEELKARLGPFEFEKVSAALAAILEKARRSPFGRKRKKKK